MHSARRCASLHKKEPQHDLGIAFSPPCLCYLGALPIFAGRADAQRDVVGIVRFVRFSY